MSDKEKKQIDREIKELQEDQQKGFTRDKDYSDYAEKMQSPEPWPEPPADKGKNDK